MSRRLDQGSVDFSSLLLGLLAPAALFYAVGYLIIGRYVTEVHIHASYWHSEQFYREAGASFLIDTLLAFLLLPYVFVSVGFVLVLCTPLRSSVQTLTVAESATWLGRRWTWLRIQLGTEKILLSVCAALALAAVVTVRYTDDLIGWLSPEYSAATYLLGEETVGYWADLQTRMMPGALFLAISVPTLIALLAALARTFKGYRLKTGGDIASHSSRDSILESSSDPVTHLLSWALLALLMIYIPVAYGARYFDIVAVKLRDPTRCVTIENAVSATRSAAAAQSAASSASAPEGAASSASGAQIAASSAPASAGGQAATDSGADCYLIGKHDSRYLLLRKATASNDDPYQRLVITQVTGKDPAGLEPFSVTPNKAAPLRRLIFTTE